LFHIVSKCPRWCLSDRGVNCGGAWAVAGKLNTKKLATLKRGTKTADGGGLYAISDPRGRITLGFLFTINRRRRLMSLGRWPDVSLATARELAADGRRKVRAGIDPIDDRKAEKRQAPTFNEVADELIRSKTPAWKSPRSKDQWRQRLRDYAKPLLTLPVDRVDSIAVLGALKPIWHAKPETASRVRAMIEAVCDYAKAAGYRTGENPAAWRGNLAHLLPQQKKVAREHFAAMPYAEVGGFVQALRAYQHKSVAAYALELLILTGLRSNEVLGGRWSEIDIANALWVIPKERMKTGKEHRVPLSPSALRVVNAMAAAKRSDWLFPSPRGDGGLSHIVLQKVMAKLGVDFTVHGFRSSLRDWAGDETSFPREVCEGVLAHVVGGVEGAYRRSDALEKRRALLGAWASFIADGSATANVITLIPASR
jgi:integrase